MLGWGTVFNKRAFCGVSQLSDHIRAERHHHHLRLSGVRGYLGLSGISDERSGDADLVEEVGLGVGRIESFAHFAQVVIETVGTAIADAADWDDLAVVARYAAVHI